MPLVRSECLIIFSACVFTFAAVTPVIGSVNAYGSFLNINNYYSIAIYYNGSGGDGVYPSSYYDDRLDSLRPHERYFRVEHLPAQGGVAGSYSYKPGGYDLIPSTGGECIQRLINSCAYNTVETVPDLPVKGSKTEFVERIQSTSYKHVKSSSVVLENNSSINQEGSTVQYTESTTSTFEFSITQTIGIKASAKLSIPLVAEASLEISAGFSFGEKWTGSKEKTIVYPSQKVVAPLKSRVRLTFHVYMAHFTTKYLSTFIMDPEHDLIKRCIKRLGPSVTLNLNPNGIANNAKAIFTKKRQEIINMPTIFVSEGYEVRVYISEPEPISATIQDTSIPTIPIHNLDKTINYFKK